MKRTGTNIALKLRRQPTEAEKKFWSHIRNRQVAGAKFRRQWPIGRFVGDFVCIEAKLVVEIDGGQHADSQADAIRTQELAAAGYNVLRFWNNDVMNNIDGVLQKLTAELMRS